MDIEGKYLNTLKDIYVKPTGNIIFNGEMLKSISSKIRNKTRSSVSPLLLNIVLEVLAMDNQIKKRNKRNPNWKICDVSLFADDMVLYIENHEEAMRKVVEIINEFNNVAG